jgi:electron transport complex protein RnfC
MMGIAQYTLDVPVIKGTSGILALSKKEAEIKEELPCIRCGRCVEACPMGLLPTTIALFAEKEKFDDAQRYGANSCIECGCCAYVCPAKRDLVHYIRLAKAVLSARRKR